MVAVQGVGSLSSGTPDTVRIAQLPHRGPCRIGSSSTGCARECSVRFKHEHVLQMLAAEQRPILAIKQARVGDFNGRSLSSLNSSSITIDPPDVPEAQALQQWCALQCHASCHPLHACHGCSWSSSWSCRSCCRLSSQLLVWNDCSGLPRTFLGNQASKDSQSCGVSLVYSHCLLHLMQLGAQPWCSAESHDCRPSPARHTSGELLTCAREMHYCMPAGAEAMLLPALQPCQHAGLRKRLSHMRMHMRPRLTSLQVPIWGGQHSSSPLDGCIPKQRRGQG